jgi:heptosyltransferase II
MPELSGILVVAPNWLGDAVMALPALADVRRAYPQAQLAVAARRSVAPLYEMVPGVDRLVTLQWQGSAFDRRLLTDVAQMKAVNADAAVLLPNSFSAAWTVRRADVAHRWGYASDLRRPLLTRAIRRPRRSLHQAAYYQHLVQELGMSAGDREPVIAVPTAAVDEATALLAARGRDPSRPLLVVAPGAAYGTAKRWLPAHFGTLLTSVIRDRRAQCALVGAHADAETARWVVEATDVTYRKDVIDLTGLTTLRSLAGVMTLAAACVSNDSGAMHLAGAVGTPLAAVFGPTRDHETAPLTRATSRAEVLVNHVWCRPCMLRECPIDHRCMTGLRPERVFASVRGLMESRS